MEVISLISYSTSRKF